MLHLLFFILNTNFQEQKLLIKQPIFFNSSIIFTQANRKIIEYMKNNDTLNIIHYGNSCVDNNSKKQIISFRKNNDSLFVKYKEFERVILKSELNYLISFEENANRVSKIKCTYSERYLFYLNRKLKKTKVDNSCSWNGFDELLKTLKL